MLSGVDNYLTSLASAYSLTLNVIVGPLGNLAIFKYGPMVVLVNMHMWLTFKTPAMLTKSLMVLLGRAFILVAV